MPKSGISLAEEKNIMYVDFKKEPQTQRHTDVFHSARARMGEKNPKQWASYFSRGKKSRGCKARGPLKVGILPKPNPTNTTHVKTT